MLSITCLLLCVLGTRASDRPWSLADLGQGEPKPANCQPSSDMPTTWVEMTDLLNFTQYKNQADSDLSEMPDPLPFPFSLTATDSRAPGWVSTCIARSPTAPEDCQGDACNVYIEEWGIAWLEFALLNCFGGYPNASAVSFFGNPYPPPGQVALTVTQTCKNYYYGPTDQWDFFYSVTDPWGYKWAMQTSHMNDTTAEEFDANIASVVWPEGWAVEKVSLNDTVEMVPYAVGSACYAMIIKDSNFNSWHQYTYPEGGLTAQDSLLSAMGDTCTVLDGQYTLSNMKDEAMAAGPSADTAGAPAPTEAPSSGAGAANRASLLLAAMAVAAALF